MSGVVSSNLVEDIVPRTPKSQSQNAALGIILVLFSVHSLTSATYRFARVAGARVVCSKSRRFPGVFLFSVRCVIGCLAFGFRYAPLFCRRCVAGKFCWSVCCRGAHFELLKHLEHDQPQSPRMESLPTRPAIWETFEHVLTCVLDFWFITMTLIVSEW